jgi:hypothetical protein
LWRRVCAHMDASVGPIRSPMMTGKIWRCLKFRQMRANNFEKTDAYCA